MLKKVMQSEAVMVAIVGVFGTAIGAGVTGIFSNWDKLTGKVVEAPVVGYKPTGNFETELRYYFDVSGARQSLEAMQHQILLQSKVDLLSKFPNDAAKTNLLVEWVEKELPKLDDVLRAILPVYQKHFTLTEIQELNKFYSTDVMQGMVKK